MLGAKFGWNWPCGSGEENFLISSMYVCYFYLPLEKGGAPNLNKLQFHSSKDALYWIWLKLAQWFWRRFYKKFLMYFCYFVIISPWKKEGPFICTKLNSLHPRMLCTKFGWNCPLVLEKKKKMWKVYDNDNYDDTAADYDGQQTNCDQKSSLELLAQVI